MWSRKLGRAESLGIFKASQTVLAKLMASHIWHQLDGSIGLDFRKGTMATTHIDAQHFISSLNATGTFQAAPSVLELRGSESEYVC